MGVVMGRYCLAECSASITDNELRPAAQDEGERERREKDRLTEHGDTELTIVPPT